MSKNFTSEEYEGHNFEIAAKCYEQMLSAYSSVIDDLLNNAQYLAEITASKNKDSNYHSKLEEIIYKQKALEDIASMFVKQMDNMEKFLPNWQDFPYNPD